MRSRSEDSVRRRRRDGEATPTVAGLREQSDPYEEATCLQIEKGCGARAPQAGGAHRLHRKT